MIIVILAGGAGSRLFPLSTKELPKPFLLLSNGNTLLKQTVKRFIHQKDVSKIVICTLKDYEEHVNREIEGIEKCRVVFEPERKNTLAAITFTLNQLKGAQEPIFVVPVDHYLSPENKLVERMSRVAKALSKEQMVCFGVKPSYPETEYGYIKIKENENSLLSSVESFVEKPDLKKAEQYLASQDYLWNMGVLGFYLSGFYEKLRVYQPSYARLLYASPKKIPEIYKRLPKFSVDQGLLQKVKSLYYTELAITWLDIGNVERFFKSKELINK
jgi:mannose-1-phosphate guanylyltransferase